MDYEPVVSFGLVGDRLPVQAIAEAAARPVALF